MLVMFYDKCTFESCTLSLLDRNQSVLQWGQCSVGDPADWPKPDLPEFWVKSMVFLHLTSCKTQSSLNAVESRPSKILLHPPPKHINNFLRIISCNGSDLNT